MGNKTGMKYIFSLEIHEAKFGIPTSNTVARVSQLCSRESEFRFWLYSVWEIGASWEVHLVWRYLEDTLR